MKLSLISRIFTPLGIDIQELEVHTQRVVYHLMGKDSESDICVCTWTCNYVRSLLNCHRYL